MENFFITKDKKDCNGCGVCALKCPHNAIIMEADNEGFLYPKIDRSKCINCGLCERICPNKEYGSNKDEVTYIAINNNIEEKKKSSSGGMFFPLARYILAKNGVVFGVVNDEKLNAKHDYAESLCDIKKMQGSKYVKSDLNDTYQKAEKFLKDDRYVLFSGTPCQCQGLRTFLCKEYEKLITCEIICHANPSPKVYDMYKKNLEAKYGKKLKNIAFRSKENGWRNQTPIIEFEDGYKIEDTSYFYAFVNELINRPSCYNCHFCGRDRYSDFTIGDLWGVEKIDSSIENDETGISLLNVNTMKGKKIFEEIKSDLFVKEVDTDLAFSYNHHCNLKPHKKRDEFFSLLEKGKINDKNVSKYLRKYVKIPFIKKVLKKIKKMILK